MLVPGVGDTPRILPKPATESPPKLLKRNEFGEENLVNHFGEWMAACRGEGRTLSNFSYAGPMTESLLLGNVAVQAGRKIEWDGPNLCVTNHEAANRFVNKAYRKGWQYSA
jgi:hypothetical protein